MIRDVLESDLEPEGIRSDLKPSICPGLLFTLRVFFFTLYTKFYDKASVLKNFFNA